jgi:hypothetical protein
MPDFSVHDADPGVHDGRSQRSRWSDLGVHDAPIRAFTMVRFPQSASTSAGNGVGLTKVPFADPRETVPSKSRSGAACRGSAPSPEGENARSNGSPQRRSSSLLLRQPREVSGGRRRQSSGAGRSARRGGQRKGTHAKCVCAGSDAGSRSARSGSQPRHGFLNLSVMRSLSPMAAYFALLLSSLEKLGGRAQTPPS